MRGSGGEAVPEAVGVGLVGLVVLVVDAANVVGSRPDGWWRDRAGAATRLLDGLARLPGSRVRLPDDRVAEVVDVRVVLEGQARRADISVIWRAGADVRVVLAPGVGDDTIVQVARDAVAEARAEVVDEAGADGLDGPRGVVVVVTADRGLRQRLPTEAVTVGPRWLTTLLDVAREGGGQE